MNIDIHIYESGGSSKAAVNLFLILFLTPPFSLLTHIHMTRIKMNIDIHTHRSGGSSCNTLFFSFLLFLSLFPSLYTPTYNMYKTEYSDLHRHKCVSVCIYRDTEIHMLTVS